MAETRLSNLGANGELLYKGLKLVTKANLQKPRTMEYPDIVTKKSSNQKAEKYGTIGNIGLAAEKAEGFPITFHKIEYKDTTTITNKTYTNGLQLSMEASDDELYGVVDMAKGEELVSSMLKKREEMVAAAYNGAFTDTGADGVATISDSHPLKNSLSLNDNLITGALTPENLKKGINQFNVIFDQAGRIMDSYPTHLLVHKEHMFKAVEILRSALLAFEMTNTTNSLKDILKLVLNRRLTINRTTDVAPWFLLDKTLADSGCVFQERQGIATDMEVDFDTRSYKFAVIERYGVGFIAPSYGIVGSAGS